MRNYFLSKHIHPQSLLHTTKPKMMLHLHSSIIFHSVNKITFFSHAKGHLYIFNICKVTLSHNIHQAGLTMNIYRIYKQGYCSACQNVGILSTDDTDKTTQAKITNNKNVTIKTTAQWYNLAHNCQRAYLPHHKV